MCTFKTTCVLSVVIGLLATAETSGQDTSVGLYYPDFRAVRTLFNPKGTSNVPEGDRQAEIVAAWKSLSTNSKDLLLQERDLALLVVDSNGNWRYRTSGVHTLKSLHETDAARNQEDLANLVKILRNPWFQSLRDFYNELLFTRATSPKRLGTLLASVDNFNDAGQDQKNWFRSIVGAEIAQMDNVLRKGFLLDEDYGASFVEAVAVAEAHREQRLAMIARYFKEGPDEDVGIGKMAFHTVDAPDEFSDDEYVNVISVGGKRVMEMNAHTGMVYISAKDDKAGPTLLHTRLRADDLQRSLQRGELVAYFAPAGTQKVYGVNADDDKQ